MHPMSGILQTFRRTAMFNVRYTSLSTWLAFHPMSSIPVRWTSCDGFHGSNFQAFVKWKRTRFTPAPLPPLDDVADVISETFRQISSTIENVHVDAAKVLGALYTADNTVSGDTDIYLV